jgi:intergrase/recombinase
MKILEIFEQKLRYKNYSDKTIRNYLSYLKQFIQTQNIKDPYQVSTNQICEFLHTNIVWLFKVNH